MKPLFVLYFFLTSSIPVLYAQHSLTIDVGFYGRNSLISSGAIKINDSLRIKGGVKGKFNPLFEINYNYAVHDKFSIGLGVLFPTTGTSISYDVITKDYMFGDTHNKVSSSASSIIFPLFTELHLIPFIKPVLGMSWVKNYNRSGVKLEGADYQRINELLENLSTTYKSDFFTYDLGLSVEYKRFHVKALYRQSFGYANNSFEFNENTYFFPQKWRYLMIEVGYEIFNTTKGADEDN